MNTLKRLAVTEQEKNMFMSAGNKVYTDLSVYEVDSVIGNKLTISDSEGDVCIVNKDLFNILPQSKSFKNFVSESVLIHKYKVDGEINPDLSKKERSLLDSYMDSYMNMQEDPDMFFNGNEYILINPTTLSHVEYDIDTGIYMVVALDDYFETKSLELAMKPSFEFQYPQ